MTVIEIVLLILGALIFAASFIIPEKMSKKGSDSEAGMGGAVNNINAREMVETMKEDIERQVRLAVDTSAEAAVEDAVLRSERNIERVTNEKMMAIDEYAQTVIQDINKNHKEVVFLYDMLENKTVDIKNTVRKAENTKNDIEETGKKVRSELESIARNSARTVIANSEKAKAEPAAPKAATARAAKAVSTSPAEPIAPIAQATTLTPAAPMSTTSPAAPTEPIAPAVSVEPIAQSEPLKTVSVIPAPAPAPSITEAEMEAEVRAVENSMKEKGVPKLGRALAAAFAQATMTSAAQEEVKPEAPAAEAFVSEMQAQAEAQVQAEAVSEAPAYAAPIPAAPISAAPVAREMAEETMDQSPLSDLYAAANPAYRAEQVETPDEGDVVFSNAEDLQGLVISMHRQGINDVEIAKRLSIGVGEVKLMIGLYAN